MTLINQADTTLNCDVKGCTGVLRYLKTNSSVNGQKMYVFTCSRRPDIHRFFTIMDPTTKTTNGLHRAPKGRWGYNRFYD